MARERKPPVATYQVDTPTKKEFVIPQGLGTKLRDIPNSESTAQLLTCFEALAYYIPCMKTHTRLTPNPEPYILNRTSLTLNSGC